MLSNRHEKLHDIMKTINLQEKRLKELRDNVAEVCKDDINIALKYLTNLYDSLLKLDEKL